MGDVIQRDFGGRAEVKEANPEIFPCRHEVTVVDEMTRTVACASCGAPLDPFQVLLEYSRKERHWRGWMAEVTRCENELKELKAEERKVKARTRAASRKDAETAVADERARTERERFQVIQAARDVAALAKRIEQLNTRK